MKQKVRPYQLVIGLGVVLGLYGIASGVLPLITEWFDDSPRQREVFVDIPGSWKLVFYTVIPVLFVYGGYSFAMRVKNWERGNARPARDHRADAAATAQGLPRRRLHADAAARSGRRRHALAHLLLLPHPLRRHRRARRSRSRCRRSGSSCTARPIRRTRSSATPPAPCSCSASVGRSCAGTSSRPYRIRIKSKPEHIAILGVFFLLGVTGFVAEGLRIAFIGRPDYEKWSFVGYPAVVAVPQRRASPRLASGALGRHTWSCSSRSS